MMPRAFGRWRDNSLSTRSRHDHCQTDHLYRRLRTAPLSLKSMPEFCYMRRMMVLCMDSGNGAASGDLDGNDSERGTVLDGESSEDDEIEPLRDALERAKRKAGKSSFKREALEAEAQNLAELAVEGLEAFEVARDSLEGSIRAKEEALSEKKELIKEVHLTKTQISALESLREDLADSGDIIEELDSLESSRNVNEDSNAAAEEAEAETEESKKPNTDGRRTIQSVDEELTELLSSLTTSQARINELDSEIKQLEKTIEEQNSKVNASRSVAQEAESRVQAVMQAAQTAVTAELESKAVLKETENAFKNASIEIDVLASQEVDIEDTKRIREEMQEVLKETKKSQESILAESGAPSGASGDGAAPSMALPSDQTPSGSTKNVKDYFTNNKWIVVAGGVVLASALLLACSPQGGKMLTQFSLSIQKLLTKPMEIISGILPDTHGHQSGFGETIWLLLASVVMVPFVCEVLPGATPVLGFLLAGALVGPHALGIIKNIEKVRHLAELGVVFLLFNIGLELSLERLRSMAKFVFGMGSVQVLLTTAVVAWVASALAGLPGPSAVILGAGLALSSTAVAMQVLQERNESGSRHGRATFSILLLQDLAVVVVLMLVPLLSQQTNSQGGGMGVIFKALGVAAIKAVVCITGIILGGRVLLRPIYNMVAQLENKEIFAALTLLVVLGTSELTQFAGLSLALGAFLAGLLLAETEYVVQVESDIEPYKGLLMGLFFMTVGMEISVGLMISSWRSIIVQLSLLIAGKIALMVVIGPVFGLSKLTALRSALLLAPGGEFAFVAFGEAVNVGLLPAPLVTQLYLVVSLSMALLPYLAIAGAKIGKVFEKADMKTMQPSEDETSHLKDHIIIAGYGRVGQLIAQLLSERLIPFVAVDTQSQRVQHGKSQDLPVYFGDAGSHQVLHSIGAARASCIVVVLDSPGSNYRCVWTMKRHFPNVKTYVRAFDMDHARNLERAGAAVVVPETLEPSLQLAASVLAQVRVPEEEIGNILDEFRRDHFAELESLSLEYGFSLGYGYSHRSSYANNNDDTTTEATKEEAEEKDIDDDTKSTGIDGVIATP
eukprot:g4983.t1